MYAFPVDVYNAPYGPIWIQFGEVAFSVNCFTAPYCPIWIQFVEVHLDPCAFDCTKFDDNWVRFTGLQVLGFLGTFCHILGFHD